MVREVGGERFLTEAEAAAMLQPFMPHKNALTWLSGDRRSNPIIPFNRLDGEIHYREADLVTFVRYGLKTKPILRGLARRMIAVRRQTTDRRSGKERRRAPERRMPADRRGRPVNG